MIAIHAPNDEQAQRLAAALQPDFATIATSSWAGLEAIFRRASCAVLCLPVIPSDLGFRLEGLRAVRPSIPLVVVTNADRQNSRRLGSILVAEVIWYDEAESNLCAVVAAIVCSGHLARLAASLQLMPGLDPIVCRALHRACRGDVPPAYANGLVSLSGERRWTFYRHWAAAFPDEAIPASTVVALLDTVYSCELALATSEWAEAVARLRVSRETLLSRIHEATGMDPDGADPALLLRVATIRLDAIFTLLSSAATYSRRNATTAGLL